tara:strand:- start:1329 stop:1604 length:276 start_codon:yes stop_codon:yes gene_type:complete
MPYNLKPLSKEIDSTGNFSQKTTNMLKRFGKNLLEGMSGVGALKAINNSYGADLKRGREYYTDRSKLIEQEAEMFIDSLNTATKRKLDKLK